MAGGTCLIAVASQQVRVAESPSGQEFVIRLATDNEWPATLNLRSGAHTGERFPSTAVFNWTMRVQDDGQTFIRDFSNPKTLCVSAPNDFGTAFASRQISNTRIKERFR